MTNTENMIKFDFIKLNIQMGCIRTGTSRRAGNIRNKDEENMEENRYESLKLQNQLCFPLYAGARKIVNLYTPYLKPLGITYTQYIVLLVLWETDDQTVGDLCRKLYLDSGTLTPVLKKMESLSLVCRKREKEDERVVRISLTEKGRELREKAVEIPAQIGSCVAIPGEDAMRLYEILYKILDA